MTNDTRTEGSPAESIHVETTVQTPADWSPHQWGDRRQAPAAVLPEAQPAAETREMTMVLSDESVDSYGTVFEVGGWRDLRPGGVPLLVSHDRDRMPVGRIERIEKTAFGSRKVLLAHARFAPKGASKAADEAYQMARAGAWKDVSVGFHPHSIRRPDKTEREQRGMPEHGVVFTSTELLEGSLVAVPANKGANVLSVRSAGNAPMEPATISGGNEEILSLQHDVALQGERLAELERAVQALSSRDIGGKGGPQGHTKPEQLPRRSDDLYRALLDKAVTLQTRATDDRRDPSGPTGRQPADPAADA